MGRGTIWYCNWLRVLCARHDAVFPEAGFPNFRVVGRVVSGSWVGECGVRSRLVATHTPAGASGRSGEGGLIARVWIVVNFGASAALAELALWEWTFWGLFGIIRYYEG